MEDNKIVIYQTPDGQTELDVRLQEETVWLDAEQMATLFDRDTKTIRKYINNAIKEELADVVVVAKFATTTQHGAIAGKEVKIDVFRYALQTCRICSSASTERQGQDAPPDRRTIRPLCPIAPIGRGDTETTEKYWI